MTARDAHGRFVSGGGSVKDTASSMLQDVADDIGGEYEVTITPDKNTEGDEASNADKLRFLAAQDRDFLAVTDEMGSRIGSDLNEAVAAFLRNNLPPGDAFEAVGESVLAHISERFNETTSSGPPDVRMEQLSDTYVARKHHAEIGVLTGHLAESLRDAKVETRRTRS